MTCEYMAQQEGVLCEEVLLLSETEDACVKVKVHARVMGEARRTGIPDGKPPTRFRARVCFVGLEARKRKPPRKLQTDEASDG